MTITKALALTLAAVIGASGAAFAAPAKKVLTKKPVTIDKGLDALLSGEIASSKKKKRKPKRKLGKKLSKKALQSIRRKKMKIKLRKLTPAQRAAMRKKAKAAEAELLGKTK